MGRRWIDRGLVAAALVLCAVILAGALSSRVSFGRHSSPGPARPPATTATAPDTQRHISIVVGGSDIELHGSEIDVMRRCSVDRLRVDVFDGQSVTIGYDGPPCHMPRVAIVALSRSPDGKAVSRRPALAGDAFPPTLAGETSESVPLATGLLRCRSGPIELHASDHGRTASGTIRCRGQH